MIMIDHVSNMNKDTNMKSLQKRRKTIVHSAFQIKIEGGRHDKEGDD